MKKCSPQMKTEILHVQAGDCRLPVKKIWPDRPLPRALPLIFLHEGLGSLAMWKDFPEKLCSALRCPGLIYTRRGYTDTAPLPAGPRALDYLLEEAETYLPALLDALEIGECIPVGHSDGGSIALLGAALYGERFKGIITEAAHVYNEDITRAGIRKAVRMYEQGNLREKLRFYHGENTDGVFYRWALTWLSPAFVHWNIEKYLPEIRCPLLLIQGEADEYATAGHIRDIARQVSGPARVRLIPGCGHVPHFQAEETVLEAMRSFAASCMT